MSRSLWCLGTLWVCSFLIVGRVHAGPIELFDGAQIKPGDPSSVLIQYQWAGSGFLLSHDGAKKFSLVCTSSVSTELRSEKILVYQSGGGSIYVGGFAGMWRGDQNGCGFTKIDAMNGRFVASITGDPDDLKRVYATSANGAAGSMNGVFTNDGASDEWTALGAQDTTWIQTLHVVKKGDAKRFWQTQVFPDPPDPQTMMLSNVVHYVVRYSDDGAKTWTGNELKPITQFGPEDPSASFRLIAVDPKNPDAIYGIVIRNSMPDDLLYSPMRGEPGSWSKVAEVTDLGGIAFTPDGKLYFSDKDQMTKQVSVIDTPKAAPRMITDQYVIGCLRWDDAEKRMLACKQWQFGTLDLEKGTFNTIYDMRCAESFASCPGLESICEAQLRPSWCNTDHYPSAPLCANYMVPDAFEFVEEYLDFECVDGLTVPRAMGAGGTSGSAAAGGSSGAADAGTTGGSSAGGATATAGALTGAGASAGKAGSTATAPTPPPKKSGCSIAAVGAPNSGASGSWLGWSFVGLASLVHIKRRRH